MNELLELGTRISRLAVRDVIGSDGTPCLLVHAGVLPQWSVRADTWRLAEEVEGELRSPRLARHLVRSTCTAISRIYWNDAPQRTSIAGVSIINVLTRLRFCTCAGRARPEDQGRCGRRSREASIPWFDVPGRATAGCHGDQRPLVDARAAHHPSITCRSTPAVSGEAELTAVSAPRGPGRFSRYPAITHLPPGLSA